MLADWAGTGATEIVPVVRRMREILLGSARLFADETTMPVLDPGRGKTKKGYAWAIARDDRLQRFHLKYSAGALCHARLTRGIELYVTKVIPLVRERLD